MTLPKTVAAAIFSLLVVDAHAGTYRLPDGTTLRPGQGFDTLLNEERAACVREVKVPSSGSAEAQKVTFEMRYVESLEELKERLGIALSASANLGLWQGSVESSFSRQQRRASLRTYFLVRVVVDNVALKLEPQLSGYGDALKDTPAQFFARCGTEWISEIHYGGEFAAILTFESQTREDKEDLVVKLKASGNTWSASAEFSRAFEQSAAKTSKDVQILRKGPVSSLPELTPSALLAYALDFPAKVAASNAGNPYPYSFTTSPWNVVPYAPLVSRTTLSNNLLKLEAISRRLDDSWMLLNDIREIEDHPDHYVLKTPETDLQKLNLAHASLISLTEVLATAVRPCGSITVECRMPQNPPVLVSLPVAVSRAEGCRRWSDGFCTECRFTPMSYGTLTLNIPEGSKGFENTCAGMKPGEVAIVRVVGSVGHTGAGAVWEELSVHSALSPCSGGYVCHDSKNNPPGDYFGFDISIESSVGPDGRVPGSVVADRCTCEGEKHCALVLTEGFQMLIRTPNVGKNTLR